jgi:hypothetical protein
MRLQMAKPWNAVVATTVAVAEQYIEAFGLSKEIWVATDLQAVSAGEQYHRLVLIRPHWHISAAEYSDFQSHAALWLRRVAPDGHLTII